MTDPPDKTAAEAQDRPGGVGRRLLLGLAAALPRLLLAALAGALLALAYPPADVGLLAFVALVPLLTALRSVPTYKEAALCGAIASLTAYLPALAWVRSVAVPGWLALSIYLGLYLVFAAILLRWFQRRFRPWWPLLGACLWAGLELVRARLGPGFPWLFLGYTQYRWLPLIQAASLGGVYAVSFLVFLVNAAAAESIAGAADSVQRRGIVTTPLAWGAGALVMLGLACVWGGRALAGVETEEGPVVGVVQQNLPRIVSEIFSPEKTLEQYYRERAQEVQLCAQLTAELRGVGVRMVVWPESTVSVPLDLPPEIFSREAERELHRQAMAYFTDLGQDMGCYFLIGAPSYVAREVARSKSLLYGVGVQEEFSNSAIFLSPDAKVIDRYDKIRLVPFGEYIPLRDVLPFLQRLTPIGRNLTPGRTKVIFDLPGADASPNTHFAALVCYETVFADLTSAFRRLGAEFFVNVTDEGWYVVPDELHQHLAMAVFRAIETRATVVRAANTGVSCFIGPTGDIYARLRPWTRGVLHAPVRICSVMTPYVRHGDVFGVVCALVAGGLPVLLLVVARARKAGRSAPE